MSTQIIAVDIDDVLAAHADAFVAYSNQRWGTRLTVDDYDEHWAKVWHVDMDELASRADAYHSSGMIGTYRNIPQAETVLRKLKERFRLYVVTSRRRQVQRETLDWIDRYYAGLFDDVVFAGFFDGALHMDLLLRTKAGICRQIGAGYLIDDQLKHCTAAAADGMNALLFGDYAWNKAAVLPDRMTRCENWEQVDAYFNDR